MTGITKTARQTDCMIKLCFVTYVKEHTLINIRATKGQLNSEWIYEVIDSPKIATKNYQDFCPGSLLQDREEI